ncbi:MAG TPA: ATP-binding protein [Eubacterium sp.]|jgi:Mrp family chromosome partitioning ATPase|nr:ATP-binding protein [Eubacterium sp.]
MPGIEKLEQNEYTHIKKTIGVISGKGGVGKSTVTSLLACAMASRDKKVAVIDADITGPSIQRAFNLSDAVEDGEFLLPSESKCGIKAMSVNLLLEDKTDPVLLRGPVIANTVKQFYTEVMWGDVDYMFIDMPPGTGDVALTVFQSIPLDGVIIVSTPQSLVSMIVKKAIKMAYKMNIPVLGIVENMAYIKCPDCGKRIDIFGESSLVDIADIYNIPLRASLPVNPELARAMDEGRIEDVRVEELKDLVEAL